MSERLEDKFIVFSDDSKAGYFRILYPYSCFEEGRGNIRLKAVKLVSVHDENGFLKSSFPMLPILREKTVETRGLKNNELFGTALENAEMTVYIPTKEKGSAIITIDKTYKKIIDAIYCSITEYYEQKVIKEANLQRKFKYGNEDLMKLLSEGEKEAKIKEFLSSFDAFQIEFDSIPTIVERTDYAGLKGDHPFEVVNVKFYKFNREKMQESEITSIEKKVENEKAVLNRGK